MSVFQGVREIQPSQTTSQWLSMAAMMLLPMDSSPLGPVTPIPGSGRQQSQMPLSPLNNGPSTPAHSRELPWQPRQTDHDELCRFSKYEHPKQMIFLLGQLLKLQHSINMLQPLEMIYIIPMFLKLTVDVSIPAYWNEKIGDPKLLINILEANPVWGFAAEVKQKQLSEGSGNNFWQGVDSQLAELQDSYPDPKKLLK
ncbi:hypothetical protein B0H10DRAFT_1940750 [Mycena sp. CBHHK59/15]|nr:hypothetical protein B0H10DRAFT_1940750 [Mycena sp. CBHHK59/15]